MTAHEASPSVPSGAPLTEGAAVPRGEDVPTTYESRYADALLAHRTLLLETATSRDELFDKSLIAIATGTMALSITFIRYIAPNPVFTYLLFTSWGAFTVSLLLSLLTLRLSQDGIDLEVKLIDAELAGDETPEGNSYRRTVDRLGWFSFAALVVGLWAFALFALLNVERSDNGKEDVPHPPASTPTEGKTEGRKEEKAVTLDAAGA